jgi:hypothetical protein
MEDPFDLPLQSADGITPETPSGTRRLFGQSVVVTCDYGFLNASNCFRKQSFEACDVRTRPILTFTMPVELPIEWDLRRPALPWHRLQIWRRDSIVDDGHRWSSLCHLFIVEGCICARGRIQCLETINYGQGPVRKLFTVKQSHQTGHLVHGRLSGQSVVVAVGSGPCGDERAGGQNVGKHQCSSSRNKDRCDNDDDDEAPPFWSNHNYDDGDDDASSPPPDTNSNILPRMTGNNNNTLAFSRTSSSSAFQYHHHAGRNLVQ